MVSEFEALLSDTRAQLEEMRTRGAMGPEPAAATATALNGRITVDMAANGRLTSLTLDPAVLRMDERALAREIVSAVNTAWTKRQGADEAAAASAAIDPAALQRQLTELQDRGIATMRRFSESLQETVARIERSTSP